MLRRACGGLIVVFNLALLISCPLSASAQEVAVDSRIQTPDALHWTNTLVPGEWCGTYHRHVAELIAQGIDLRDAASACPPNGSCDDPLNRNASIPTGNTPIKTVRLSIHVFCENNGGNCAATQADVDNAVARLNANYAPWRIQFVYEANFIKSTKYRYLDPNGSEQSGMKLAYANSPATKLNIYVVNTGPNGPSWATLPFWPQALSTQGGIVIHDALFVAAPPLPTIVLTHEVGHCLGLLHTFSGVDEVALCSDCYEPAGRTPEQGDVTGDWCSDTNPTPKNINNCFDPPETDPCSGNPWVATPFLNYMSYSHPCEIEFTAQQAGRMHCWTTAVLSGWLQLPQPPNAPGAPTLTKLGGGQIRVAWADNSNDEDGFQVERETKSGSQWINTQTIAIVGANITSVTDAPGSGTSRYHVQAFNGVGASAWSAWTQIKN